MKFEKKNMKVYEVIEDGLNISMKCIDSDKDFNHCLGIGDFIFIDGFDFYVKKEVTNWPYSSVYKSCNVLRKIRFRNSKAYINESGQFDVDYYWDIIDNINIVDPKISGKTIGESIELLRIKESIEWESDIKLNDLGI